MTGESMDAILRVRLPAQVKARLEKIAIARNTDISELARQALFEKYPELRDPSAPVMNEGAVAYKRPLDELVQALHAQTEAVNKLIKQNSAGKK